MVIDTSAIVAIVRGEPGAERIEEALAYSEYTAISAATAVELAVVLQRSLGPADAARVQRLLDAYDVATVDFTAEQSLIAARAHQVYGRGSGHPAQLNLGDCYSYALATALGQPLLFVGAGFIHTDVTPAVD